jgi:hypothetical protein
MLRSPSEARGSSAGVAPEILRALVTRGDNEVISFEKLGP